MPKPLILGLTGPARSGKDTVADRLAVVHGYERVSFAEPIRQMLHTLGVSHAELHNKTAPIARFGGKSARELLQTLGTEWGRAMVDPDIWVNVMAQDLLALPAGMPVVISDVRFDNEAKWIVDQGGLVISVHRPERNRPWAGGIPDHPSEDPISLGYIAYTLANTGTFEQLFDQIDRWIGG